jgi:hypothetical protein
MTAAASSTGFPMASSSAAPPSRAWRPSSTPAFAFAVTMLVISLDAIPDSIGGMLSALKGVPAFAASFAQIMMFWFAHATWSRRFGLDDGPSSRLSLVLVFLVLVYVYPLKILFGSFFAWISRGWLPPVAEIHTLLDLQGMFVMYGIAFGTLSLCLAALNRQALRAPPSARRSTHSSARAPAARSCAGCSPRWSRSARWCSRCCCRRPRPRGCSACRACSTR